MTDTYRYRTTDNNPGKTKIVRFFFYLCAAYMRKNNSVLLKGVRDGFTIGMGYFAVAFSLGMIARNAGITPVMGFFSSFFTRASAGEFGVYTLIATGSGILGVISICTIANIRYLLMGAALSQKIDPRMPLWKRIIVACCITDEVFGISIAYKGKLPFIYPVSAMIVAGSMWASGMALGIAVGNILPANISEALSVALYGMFIAIFIPPARKDKAIEIAVAASFLFSLLFSYIPQFQSISAGIRITVLTIIIASATALIKPVNDEAE